MASQTRSAGLGQNVDNLWGNRDWQNPTYIYTSNGTYATVGVDGPYEEEEGEVSHWLWATDFGFTIPEGATIDGILVEFEKNSYDGDIEDDHVYIIQAGSYGGTNKARAEYWPTSDTYISHGGVADKWGLTWTRSQINSSQFGVCINVENNEEDSGDGAMVDHVRITVYYTEEAPAGTNMKIVASSAWKEADALKIKAGGAWKEGAKGWQKVGGVWKYIFG